MQVFNVKFLIYFNPKLQPRNIESSIKNKIRKLLTELRLFKFVTTLDLVDNIEHDNNKKKHETFYSPSKAETIINKRDIDDVFKIKYASIISNK